MSITIPNELLDLAKILPTPLYLVGGYVRNSLLTLNNTDIDIASELTPKDLRCILLNTEYVVTAKSERMGTVLISRGGLSFEHTTFRCESYISGKHQPTKIDLGVTIREDASRRDFTINALYYDILKKTIVDFYNGKRDLIEKVIRCVETPNYVFGADGLRILRMIRLSSELGFTIDNETLNGAKNNLHFLNDISGERKFIELIKILNSNHKYSISPLRAPKTAIEIINKLDAWQYILDLGEINIPKKYANNNIYKFFINIYSDYLQKYNITQFAYRVFGKTALNRSNKEITMLKDLLYLEYYFKFDYINLYSLYNRFNIIINELKKFDRLKYKKLIALYKRAKQNNIPMSVKELNITPLELVTLGVKKKYLNVILKKVLQTVLTENISNEKQELTNLCIKFYEELK